jgi:hypothetical protein
MVPRELEEGATTRSVALDLIDKRDEEYEAKPAPACGSGEGGQTPMMGSAPAASAAVTTAAGGGGGGGVRGDAPLSLATLADATPDGQKQMLGNRLYPLVFARLRMGARARPQDHASKPGLACKITGAYSRCNLTVTSRRCEAAIDRSVVVVPLDDVAPPPLRQDHGHAPRNAPRRAAPAARGALEMTWHIMIWSLNN